MKEIRRLRAEDVEIRPGYDEESSDGNRVQYLSYINSRSATKLLDETYLPENWNCEYKDVAGIVVCRLSIYDEETDRWVYREETGDNTKKKDQNKALFSDCLKRCISRFGVTELYSCPSIWLPKQNGYKVSKMEVNNERIVTSMEVVDRNGNVVFSWTLGQSSPTVASRDNGTILKEFCGQMKTQPGVNMDNLKEFFNYWNGRIESGQFNGIIQPQALWNKKYGKAA